MPRTPPSRPFYEDYYDRARAYRRTCAYEKALRKRTVWVETLFAEAGEPFAADYVILTEREALRTTVDERGLESFVLAALDVPVLAVKGIETTEVFAAMVDDLAATVPHVRLLELPGGHASHIENIDRFLDMSH
jgi:pimeloyl-ACP methyl ester carboxylesterase